MDIIGRERYTEGCQRNTWFRCGGTGRDEVEGEGCAMIWLERLSGWLRRRDAPQGTGSMAIVAGLPPADGPLVQKIAERLRQGDLVAGGWSAEAGALPLESYVPEAQRLVRGIALGGNEAGPPAP
jgi:hypothetical protein